MSSKEKVDAINTLYEDRKISKMTRDRLLKFNK